MAPQLIDLLSESLQLRQEIENFLTIEGKGYPLAEWVTLKEYARRFNLGSPSAVNGWINAGIVPAENVVVVVELNDLKLIRAVPYQ